MILLSLFLFIGIYSQEFFLPNSGLKDFVGTGEDQIISGKEMDRAYPWIVRVNMKIPSPCTGTLVGKRHVATAAHCMLMKPNICTERDRAVSDMSVCIGTLDAFENCPSANHHNVQNAHFFDLFKSRNCADGDDMILLELDRDATGAVPACLPTPGIGPMAYESDPNGVKLYVAGFGNNNNDVKTDINKKLRFAVAGSRVPCVLPMFADSNTICTEWSQEKSAICAGDSGGPLTEKKAGRHVLIGVNIASTGGLCALDHLIMEDNPPHQMAFNLKNRINEIMAIIQPSYGK